LDDAQKSTGTSCAGFILYIRNEQEKQGDNMIIKTDGFELEISKGGEIYLGSLTKGQTFLTWAEIDDGVKKELEKIMHKAENLIKDSETLLSNRIPENLNGAMNHAPRFLNV
jgi:hypothetical protein